MGKAVLLKNFITTRRSVSLIVLLPRCHFEDDPEILLEMWEFALDLVVHLFVIHLLPWRQGGWASSGRASACRRNVSEILSRGHMTMGGVQKGYGKSKERRARLCPKCRMRLHRMVGASRCKSSFSLYDQTFCSSIALFKCSIPLLNTVRSSLDLFHFTDHTCALLYIASGDLVSLFDCSSSQCLEACCSLWPVLPQFF